MPVVLRIGPYSFFFFSNENNEPAHIHVERDDDEAKFWLDPVRLAANHGFRTHELKSIEKLAVEHREYLLEHWNAYFAG